LSDDYSNNLVVVEAARVFDEVTVAEGALHNSMVTLIDKRFDDDIGTAETIKTQSITTTDSKYETDNQTASLQRETAKNNAQSDAQRNAADAQYIQQVAQNWQEHTLQVAEVEQSYLTAISKSRQTRDESKSVADKLYQQATEPQFAVYLQSTGTIEATRNTLLDRFTDEKNQQLLSAEQERDEALAALGIFVQ